MNANQKGIIAKLLGLGGKTTTDSDISNSFKNQLDTELSTSIDEKYLNKILSDTYNQGTTTITPCAPLTPAECTFDTTIISNVQLQNVTMNISSIIINTKVMQKLKGSIGENIGGGGSGGGYGTYIIIGIVVLAIIVFMIIAIVIFSSKSNKCNNKVDGTSCGDNGMICKNFKCVKPPAAPAAAPAPAYRQPVYAQPQPVYAQPQPTYRPAMVVGPPA